MEVTHDIRISLEQNSISKETCSRSSAYDIGQDTEFDPPLGPLLKNINFKKRRIKWFVSVIALSTQSVIVLMKVNNVYIMQVGLTKLNTIQIIGKDNGYCNGYSRTIGGKIII